MAAPPKLRFVALGAPFVFDRPLVRTLIAMPARRPCPRLSWLRLPAVVVVAAALWTMPSVEADVVEPTSPPTTPASSMPFGSLDAAAASPGRVEVGGWAVDPMSATPVTVTVTVDGTALATVTADQPRPDVGQVYPAAGANRGFVVTVVPVGGGVKRVCALAASVTLGCRQVSFPGSPLGSLDAAVPLIDGTIRMSGWALDPDVWDGPAEVHVWSDAGFGRAVLADRSRPDVASVFPGYGDRRGFEVELPVASGVRSVCAYAMNVGSGATSELGCRTVTVSSARPLGNVDGVHALPGAWVRIAGWALDPTRLAGPVDVQVWSDTGPVGVVSASASRPDVVAAFPAYASGFGFDQELAVPPGTRRVCAYAISGRDRFGAEIGCRDVAVPPRNPIGNLDSVVRRGSTFRLGGWALDGDTADAVEVHVYVNGTIAAVGRADEVRYDIQALYPAFGAGHGFEITAPIGRWPAEVCAYAINVGTGSVNSSLGCRTLPAVTAAACPVAGARFRNDWGEPRSGGRTHRGNDLMAPANTPIVTPNAGRVRFLDHVDEYPTTGGDLGGVSLGVTTADGDWWYFAHLSSINPGLVVGQQIPAGTVIGWVGQTGNAVHSVPHLHIGLYSLDVATNPFFILDAVC